jgi:hypothetical protein
MLGLTSVGVVELKQAHMRSFVVQQETTPGVLQGGSSSYHIDCLSVKSESLQGRPDVSDCVWEWATRS